MNQNDAAELIAERLKESDDVESVHICHPVGACDDASDLVLLRIVGLPVLAVKVWVL